MSTQTVRPSSSGESAKRRGQAVAGALTGVAIVVVLAVVFFVVRNNDDNDKTPVAGSAPAASQPAAAPTEAAAPTAEAPTAPAQPSAADVNTPAALSKEPDVKAGKGKLTKLAVTVLVPGTGPAVAKGQTVTANYKLISYSTGEVLDSSWSRGEPFTTQIGVGAVIQGWDQGVLGQKVGSRVQLDVPEALAYPGKGDLRFVVDILAAQ
ncbi:FKBP-type peptidyl-prolyl cis-trans isomerase [Paractinoplanes toevensis]|uniref:Peptidyl-prolyl cis-trans isomerase n=1 Tax=Paractinoplanes toevensis TaxID=571911 RepID=A0A920BQJ5_9ACTN|nr:FKBP-type peptidyl-prolyl cis-trans isomerase [Actinoplanes toevensis]GIM96766.1 hypothetical protein Ato02nite_085590 [Actinoplanes toevensis]